MSHFAFGLLRRRSTEEVAYDGVCVLWGSERQPELVNEMLRAASGTAVDNEVPFSLVRAGDDTADGLISPFVQDEHSVRKAIREMLCWVADNGGGELWLTEGFDDRFEEHIGDVQTLRELVSNHMSLVNELPSLRFKVASQ